VRKLLLTLGLVWAAMPPGFGEAAQRFDLPPGPGRELVYGHCQTCHDLQSVVDSAGIRRGAWEAVLKSMERFGLRISDEQSDRILEYLATYLGPNPPEQESGEQAAAASGRVDGEAVYADTCVACHLEDGKGKAGQFPPLAENEDLFLSPDYPAKVVLNGISGPIKVNGQSFDNAMPPFDVLGNEEIAAVITYVRSHLGNDSLKPADMSALTAEDVGKLRQQEMSSEDVHALRQSLKE